MKEGYWVVRTYKAGCVGEKTKFWVPGKRPEKRLSKKAKAKLRKQEQNEYSAIKQAARILNENYTPKDILLGLDYNAKGMKKLEKWIAAQEIDMKDLDDAQRLSILWTAADHELNNCLRRAKRNAKKLGIEIKAFYVTSDLDPYTRETVRVHHHLVINREAVQPFADAWKDLGGVDYENLYGGQEDRTPLAEYLLKQVRHVPNIKKFKTTRNMKRPEPKDRIVMSDAELRVPRHAKLVYRNEFTRSGQPQYIRYILPDWKNGDPLESKNRSRDG